MNLFQQINPCKTHKIIFSGILILMRPLTFPCSSVLCSALGVRLPSCSGSDSTFRTVRGNYLVRGRTFLGRTWVAASWTCQPAGTSSHLPRDSMRIAFHRRRTGSCTCSCTDDPGTCCQSSRRSESGHQELKLRHYGLD